MLCKTRPRCTRPVLTSNYTDHPRRAMMNCRGSFECLVEPPHALGISPAQVKRNNVVKETHPVRDRDTLTSHRHAIILGGRLGAEIQHVAHDSPVQVDIIKVLVPTCHRQQVDRRSKRLSLTKNRTHPTNYRIKFHVAIIPIGSSTALPYSKSRSTTSCTYTFAKSFACSPWCETASCS